MKQEPVAWMLNGKLHDCDPSDWAKDEYPDENVIPLYANQPINYGFNPPEGKPYGWYAYGVFWENNDNGKEMMETFYDFQKDGFKSIPVPLYTTPQLKELSDEEIDDVIDSFSGKSFGYHELIKACFKKASEK